MMEARIIEYPRSGGLDYHHNSPLIGEIPTNDYTHFHRSIDQLRSLNERGILNTNHFQNVLVPASTSPIVVQASGVYSEIKLSDDYQVSNKPMRRDGDEIMENESAATEEYKKDIVTGNTFRIIHSPQQYTITTATISPSDLHQQQQNTFTQMESSSQDDESQIKTKVRELNEKKNSPIIETSSSDSRLIKSFACRLVFTPFPPLSITPRYRSPLSIRSPIFLSSARFPFPPILAFCMQSIFFN